MPAEIVFDQRPGDLFVVRVAGNIVEPALIGSIEFAATKFASPLLVVLGHSQCGAVQATMDAVRKPGDSASPNLAAIIDAVRPSVQAVLDADASLADDELLAAAIRRNVERTIAELRVGSAILNSLRDDGRLSIVGAEYSLESGAVEFLDGVLD